ncbi:hypothetical protein M3J09_002396 [Ascochyta lentis]
MSEACSFCSLHCSAESDHGPHTQRPHPSLSSICEDHTQSSYRKYA